MSMLSTTDVVNGELAPPPATGHDPFRTVVGKTYHLPFEYSLVSQTREGGYKYDPLGPSCCFTYGEGKQFVASRLFPAEALAKQIRLGWKRGAANVLLATAPDHSGRMCCEDVEQLRQLGRILREDEKGQALGKQTPRQILAMLGAKGEAGAHPAKLEEYGRIFGLLDANDDGNLSTQEFVEDGRYMTGLCHQMSAIGTEFDEWRRRESNPRTPARKSLSAQELTNSGECLSGYCQEIGGPNWLDSTADDTGVQCDEKDIVSLERVAGAWLA